MRSFRTALSFALPLVIGAISIAPAHAAPTTAAVASSVKSGVDAWERGDYKNAVAIWRPLAIAGDPDAQFNLGQAYKLGRGVSTDLGEAEGWYQRAAKQGHLQAEDNLGLVLFTANRRQEAMSYIRRSAERGEPRAQYVLGTAHFNGDLAPRDWPRAYALTKRASDAGLGIASARLSQLDGLIPLDQRQAGLALLPVMERDEQRARLAAVNAAAPPAPTPAPSPIRTAALPPSTAGTSYTPPPAAAAARPAPPPAPAPAPVPASTAPASPVATAAAAAATEATAAAEAAATAAPAPIRSVPAPIGTVDLPPAEPGTSYPAPPLAPGAKAPAPAPAPAPTPTPTPTPAPSPAPQPAPATPAAAAPVSSSAPVRAAAASPWRAQLGAFGVEGNARNLWTALERKYPDFAGRQPYLVKTGKLTRLQVGDFAGKAEATKFCDTVRKGGQACLVVDR